MSVLVEIYDENEPLLNVLNAMLMRPRKIIFLGGNAVNRARDQRNVRRFFQALGLDIDMQFYRISVSNLPELARRLITIVEKEENVIIDVTGGNDLLLVAAGMVFSQYNAVAIAYGRLRQGYYLLEHDEQEPRYFPIDIQMRVSQAMMLAGGRILRSGHVSKEDVGTKAMQDIAAIFPFYRENRYRWHILTLYLQAANESIRGTDELQIVANREYVRGATRITAPLGLLLGLSELNLLLNLRADKHEVEFRYADSFLRQCITDAGIWLELYVYRAAMRCNRFDDVQISVVIGWEDAENTIENEVDVIATAGLTQLFISCKSGRPDWDDLSEIVTLARRFGSQCALPVLVTINDLETSDIMLCRRAASLGVALIDGAELREEVLIHRLCELADTWDPMPALPSI